MVRRGSIQRSHSMSKASNKSSSNNLIDKESIAIFNKYGSKRRGTIFVIDEKPDNLEDEMSDGDKKLPEILSESSFSDSDDEAPPAPIKFSKAVSFAEKKQIKNNLTVVNKRKAFARSSSTVVSAETNDHFQLEVESPIVDYFTEEEELVCLYVSLTIQLSKLAESKKAIDEYKKKKGLSDRCRAHLYMYEAVITQTSKPNSINKTIALLNKAKVTFQQLSCEKGVITCLTAMQKLDCQDSLKLSK